MDPEKEVRIFMADRILSVKTPLDNNNLYSDDDSEFCLEDEDDKVEPTDVCETVSKEKKVVFRVNDDIDRVVLSEEKEKKMEVQSSVSSAEEEKKKNKKKKKKEKEKENKAAKEEKKADRKPSKQVKEIQERLRQIKEGEERKKKEEEERLRKEDEERTRLEELERIAQEKKRLKKEKLLKKKQQGKLLTGKQKEEARRLEAMRKQFLAGATIVPTIPENAPEIGGVSEEETEYTLRSPICCIMGHVDTGKTKLLDCIRGTNVQQGEAGGITQQIGATYFPAENICERTKELKADAKLKVPGLLVIDTPGHESFTNLRSRGSGLCDIAILFVDIMHGLQRQTIESLNLLKMRDTNFIIALNKVDRLYGWKACHNASIVKAMKQQSEDVQFEFSRRLTQVVTEFKEQGINTELYYKNKDMGKGTFSIVPTSAISGEGIPDLLLLLVQWTAKTMAERLTFNNEVQCTVLEVKVVEGHGTTIDVILVNGVLHEGDQIVLCGMQGPIVTSIRALLTPDPMKELRVKVGNYMVLYAFSIGSFFI